jgi:hypothetical protein
MAELKLGQNIHRNSVPEEREGTTQLKHTDHHTHFRTGTVCLRREKGQHS